MSTLTPPPNPTAPAFRDTAVVRNFRTGTPDGFRPQLNTDLGLNLGREAYLRIQNYFKATALRDPTVGELRVLDAITRCGLHTPARIAVGALTTQSSAVAETWADMMHKHGVLHGADKTLKSGKHATPPCTLADALSLTDRYLHRTERPDEEESVLLSAPWQEAMAAAEGYVPVARVAVGEETRALWVRKAQSPTVIPAHAGDFILYLPHARLRQIQALVAAEAEKARPSLGDIRAVAQGSLLLTLLELCPAAELRIDRLKEGASSDGRIPVEMLCSAPTVEPDGTCGYLLRVPLKQAPTVNETLKELGITAIVCGQVRTGGNTVLLMRDNEGKRDIPAATLPAGLMRSMAAVYLYTMNAEAVEAPSPAPIFSAITRLPSAVYGESGLTPDGRETVALTLHEGRILRIPEADTLMTALSVDLPHRETAFKTAADATASAAKCLADLGVAPEHIRLTISLTAAEPAVLTDGTALTAICGIYRAAAKLGLPVEDSVVTTAASDCLLRMTVTAFARDPEVCADMATMGDRQWHTSKSAMGKESVGYLLPVLRRSYEDSLKALSAALNRDSEARCIIRPLAMQAAQTEDSAEPRYTLHPESQKNLLEQMQQWMIPVFSMNEGDTRLLLSHPAVAEALTRLVEMGYSILVLGESCKAFAEWGFLPSDLLDTRTLPAKGDHATVTYTFPAEPATRLLRTDILAPAAPREAMNARHILDLHLPDGTVIPDGFVGRDGKVLGLLNGLDTAALTCIRGNVFIL